MHTRSLHTPPNCSPAHNNCRWPPPSPENGRSTHWSLHYAINCNSHPPPPPTAAHSRWSAPSPATPPHSRCSTAPTHINPRPSSSSQAPSPTQPPAPVYDCHSVSGLPHWPPPHHRSHNPNPLPCPSPLPNPLAPDNCPPQPRRKSPAHNTCRCSATVLR